MKLDRIIALVILLFMLGYAWIAYNYQLLPFERNLPFKPNTMPLGLATVGIIFALAILFMPGRKDPTIFDESTIDTRTEEEVEESLEESLKEYDKVRPVLLICLMILYALCLRPIGFIISTTAFLTFGATILGERKFYILLPVAITGAFVIWYVVQQVLGIYLTPWPAFLTQTGG